MKIIARVFCGATAVIVMSAAACRLMDSKSTDATLVTVPSPKTELYPPYNGQGQIYPPYTTNGWPMPASKYSNLYPATRSNGWPNSYRPTSPYAPTVGNGTNMSSWIDSLPIPDEDKANLKKDINGKPRDPNHWDVGAYQYPPHPITPQNFQAK